MAQKPSDQLLIRSAMSGKRLPGTRTPTEGASGPRMHVFNPGLPTKPPSSPSLSLLLSAEVPSKELIKSEEEPDERTSYLPRYHQHPTHPARSLREYFYASEVDDDEKDEKFEPDKIEYSTTIVYPSTSPKKHKPPRPPRPLAITFKRDERLQKAFRKMRRNEWDRHPVEMEKLHEDLEHGQVAFSRWGVDGLCPDPDVFDMLMTYGAIREECEKKQKLRAGQIELGPKFLTATDIIRHYTASEKRYEVILK
ncbi:hypothetical protein ABW20_dc0108785 [Dactylellina cionopaga]|nr:hypothetical protein ABW20_dc0108785 [Dactylellina cionopaga]